MSIIIKPISELLDYEFVIPKYQRGYRWDSEQITALLNDLKAFQKDAQKDDFYCLQPIVVIKDRTNDKKFIVVDGQQRLTTIFLILKAFSGVAEKCFKLKMDQRKEQEKYVEEARFFTDDLSYKDNIDNFYVKKAFDAILNWRNADPENSTAALFMTTLLKPGHIKGYVAVIWHEIEERDAMSSFRRLNYGKIPLTSAELVKALLLQTDCYPEQDRKLQTAIAQRRAMEWDEMEHRLANPLFSSMVCRSEEEIIGIDVVLDFIADEVNNELDKHFSRNTDNKAIQDLFVYKVIDAKIKKDLAAQKDREEVISEIWSKIQDTFNRLADWYENRERFHLIGLWRLIDKSSSRSFIRKVIAKMYKDGPGQDKSRELQSKSEFIDALRRQIGSELKVPRAEDKDELTGETVILPETKQGLNSPYLRYGGKDQKRLINILTAFNVWDVHEDPSGTARFPFHLFQKYKATSLEHIHPQNITEDIKWNEACSWVKNRKKDSEEATPDVWEKVAKSFGWREPSNSDENAVKESLSKAAEEARRKVKNSVKILEDLLVDEQTFNDSREDAYEHIKVLDTLFGDMAGIDPDELHSIGNMALVSKELNSALSNSYLCIKRSIAIEYDSKPETDDKATFVPPATHKVFAKAYSAEAPHDMKFWQPEDRRNYLYRIKGVYDYFTNSAK